MLVWIVVEYSKQNYKFCEKVFCKRESSFSRVKLQLKLTSYLKPTEFTKKDFMNVPSPRKALNSVCTLYTKESIPLLRVLPTLIF